MFGPNPKKQVELKFRELFGKAHKVEVQGVRVTAVDGRRVDSFMSQIIVDEAMVATASHRDWRKAYKLLKLEVEKLYADGAIFS